LRLCVASEEDALSVTCTAFLKQRIRTNDLT